MGSQCFSVVLVGSHRLSVVLSRCRMFLEVFYGLSGSRRFSMVLCCSSCKFSVVLSGSRMFSLFLVGSQWFS